MDEIKNPRSSLNFWDDYSNRGTTRIATHAASHRNSTKFLAMVTGRPDFLTVIQEICSGRRLYNCQHTASHRPAAL